MYIIANGETEIVHFVSCTNDAHEILHAFYHYISQSFIATIQYLIGKIQ